MHIAKRVNRGGGGGCDLSSVQRSPIFCLLDKLKSNIQNKKQFN